MEKMNTLRLDRLKSFDVLLKNPGGARYFQEGRFYGVGGVYIEDQSRVPIGKLPLIVQEKIMKKGLKPYTKEELIEREIISTNPEIAAILEREKKRMLSGEEEEGEYNCPHCDKTYKSKMHYSRHLASHEA